MPFSRDKPARLLKKRRKRMKRRLIAFSLGLIFLVLLPAGVARLSFWQIEQIVISGSRTVSDELLSDRAREAISGSYLYLYPRGNTLLFSKSRIKEALLSEFPRLLSVSIDIQNFKTIEVAVEEREPQFLWCSETECFFLDAEGFIFDRAPEFTGAIYVSFFGELAADIATPIGERFLEAEEFSVLSTLVSGLKDLELSPDTVRVISEKEYEISLAGGETILVATLSSPTSTLTNLKALLLDPKLALQVNSSLSFQTLDLRYGNKVYFVKKGE